MSNYNSTLQSNNTDLQEVLQILQNKAANGGGEQATPVISVNNSTGIITATAGAKSSTYQLAFQSAKTITPTTTSQVAVSSGYYTGGNITVQGDANLVAENIKNGVSIFGVTGDYEGSGGSSGELVEYSENEDAMINDTLSVYSNDRVRTIRIYAFASCTRLTSVSFPLVTTISSAAFSGCSRLTSVSFPQATTIGSDAFNACYSLTTASFPLVTTIGSKAFQHCSSLTSVSFPQATTIVDHTFYNCSRLTTASFPLVTTIGNNAFARCSSLTSVSFPLVTFISDSAFYSCSSLTTASFPLVTTIGIAAFERCYRLTSVNFPQATSISSNAFRNCSTLTTASFPVAKTISNYAFYACYNLKSLYLLGSSVCTLVYSNAFASTPIGGYSTSAGTYGSIYVPASLLTQYQSATNWTYFSSRFVGI